MKPHTITKRTHYRAQELCERWGGRPGLPVANSRYGLCGGRYCLCGGKATSEGHMVVSYRLLFLHFSATKTVVFFLLISFFLSLLKWNMKTAGNWTVVSSIPLLPHPIFPSFFHSASATFDLLCDEFRSILLLAGRLVRLAERAPPERGRGDHQCGWSMLPSQGQGPWTLLTTDGTDLQQTRQLAARTGCSRHLLLTAAAVRPFGRGSASPEHIL